MKKNLFTLFTAICLFSCSSSDYTIEGSTDSKEMNGTIVFLKERINREWKTIDSIKVENGKFAFKGVADSAKIGYIEYEFPAGNPMRQAFVLENGKLTVRIDTTNYITIKGTKQNDLLQSYQDEKYVLYKKADAFYKTQSDSALTPAQKQTLENTMEKMNQSMVAIDKKFATENVNTLAGTHIFMSSSYNMTTAEKEAIVALLNEETKKIERIQDIISNIATEKKVAIGSTFTNITLPTLNDDTLSLSDLVGKTDYLLIDFWASWCGPCMRSLPELKTLYTTYKGSRFEILGVSLDDNREAWSATVKSKQLEWKHVSDLKGWKCEGSKAYAVSSIPNTVLIDKNGKIVGRNLSIPEIEKLLQEKLSKN